MGCSTLQLLEQQKAVEEKRSYRDGCPCWVRRKEFARGKVGRGVGTHCLPALPVAVRGWDPTHCLGMNLSHRNHSYVSSKL